MSDKSQPFFDLFDNDVDYPALNGNTEILPVGTLYNYVSSTFLNGFVNIAGKPIAAFGIFLYNDVDGQSQMPVQYREPANSFIWQRTSEQMTRREVFELVTQPGRVVHTDLGMIDCNVMILMRSGDNVYWSFDYDQDVSDCSIGRFKSDLSEEELIKIFRNRAEGLAESHQVREVFEIPLSFFTGWIKF